MPDVWSDSPITTKNEDELGRADYAAHAARLIADSHSWDDSIVFGLTGPWGSGKSSMLAMITEELKTTHTAWQVAQFTPWATGDVAGLLGEFYASLSLALPKERTKQLRNALGTLVQVTAPAATAIPWAGGALTTAAEAAGAALKQPTPWDQAFKKAAAELKKLNTPVLLIADDIDRLQTEELLAVLKVVRLLGRFPGVHYLLAYDESTLYKTLSKANLVEADDLAPGLFMEKIVQYPLVVPPLLSTQLLSRLDSGLDAALAEAERPPLTTGRLSRLTEVYQSQLSTPRAIDRYLAQLRHHLPLVAPEEIDDEDVIVLTLLRTAFPTLYQQLPRWRKELVTGHTGEVKARRNGIEQQAFDLKPLLKGLPKHSRADARTLLTALFPKLAPGTMSYASTGRRISDDWYFDRYFAMGIPSHDVSDVEVAAAAVAVGEGDPEALVSLLTHPEADRVILVIDKGRRFTDALPQDEAGDALRLELLKTLVAIDNVPDKPSFFMSPSQRVSGWASLIVTQLTDLVTADSLLDALGAAAQLAEQIDVVYYARRADGPQPACLDQAIAELSTQATKVVIDNLRARDNASHSERPGWLSHFLLSTGQIAPLASAVAAGLESGEFTIADVAARLVRTRIYYGTGTKHELGDFDQETFNALVPAAPDSWYQSAIAEVDKYDLSWANRRAYAASRAARPEPAV